VETPECLSRITLYVWSVLFSFNSYVAGMQYYLIHM
jgi:hypothetical protein